MAQARDDWFSEVLPVNRNERIMSEAAVEQQRLEYTGIFVQGSGRRPYRPGVLLQPLRRPFSARTGARRCSSPSSRAASATCQSTLACRFTPRGTSASTTPWPSGVFRSTRTTLTSWTITRATVRASITIANGSTSATITGLIWYPHDVKVSRGWISWSAQRGLRTLMLLGPKARARPAEQSLMDGINAGRKTIPLARFDAKRCAQGLECLRSYRTEWDEKARAFKKTPDHGWASHGSDAWRYLSLSWRAPMREPEEEKAPIGIPLVSTRASISSWTSKTAKTESIRRGGSSYAKCGSRPLAP